MITTVGLTAVGVYHKHTRHRAEGKGSLSLFSFLNLILIVSLLVPETKDYINQNTKYTVVLQQVQKDFCKPSFASIQSETDYGYVDHVEHHAASSCHLQ